MLELVLDLGKMAHVKGRVTKVEKKPTFLNNRPIFESFRRYKKFIPRNTLIGKKCHFRLPPPPPPRPINVKKARPV